MIARNLLDTTGPARGRWMAVLLAFALLAVVPAARGSIVVRSAGGSGEADLFGGVSASVSIDGSGLDGQLEVVDYSADGVSVMFRYAAQVPDPVGSSFWVYSYTKLSSTRDDVAGSAFAGFFITFEVDKTQEYQFSIDIMNPWGNSDGLVTFDDLTDQTALFSAFFGDLMTGEMTFTLQAGHLYQFIAPLDVIFDAAVINPSGREWAFRLAALPEPSTVGGLAVGGLVLIGSALRRRSGRARASGSARGDSLEPGTRDPHGTA